MLNYRKSNQQINEINNQKAESLNYSIKLLVIGISISIISPLIILWLKANYVIRLYNKFSKWMVKRN